MDLYRAMKGSKHLLDNGWLQEIRHYFTCAGWTVTDSKRNDAQHKSESYTDTVETFCKWLWSRDGLNVICDEQKKMKKDDLAECFLASCEPTLTSSGSSSLFRPQQTKQTLSHIMIHLSIFVLYPSLSVKNFLPSHCKVSMTSIHRFWFEIWTVTPRFLDSSLCSLTLIETVPREYLDYSIQKATE
jgi:hypothetical protein